MFDGMELKEVRLLQLPLELYRSSQQHHDDLFREFALIRFETEKRGGGNVTGRLLDLVNDLTQRFAQFTSGTNEELQAASSDPDRDSIDLTFRLPAAAESACKEFDILLDEADDFCRSGELLTVEMPEDAIQFRRWYLGQFIDQISGQPPTSWPKWASSRN